MKKSQSRLGFDFLKTNKKTKMIENFDFWFLLVLLKKKKWTLYMFEVVVDWEQKKIKNEEMLKMVSFGVCDLESQMKCRIDVCTLKS